MGVQSSSVSWKPLGRRPRALGLAGLAAVAEARARPPGRRRPRSRGRSPRCRSRWPRPPCAATGGLRRSPAPAPGCPSGDRPSPSAAGSTAPARQRAGAAAIARQIERAGEHRRLHPARPDRAAELVGDHPVLQLLDPAAELDELGAQARVVRLAHVAGDQMVRQPERGRDREQRPVLERLVAAADVGRATRTSRPRPAAAPAACRAPGSPWRCRRRRPASRRAAPPRVRSW